MRILDPKRQNKLRTSAYVVVVAFLLGALFSVFSKLPGVPYNLRELMWHGGNPLNWLMFGLWLCWIGIGSGIMIRVVRRGPLHTLWMPLLAAGISIASFLFLSLAVTPESIHDILGSPVWTQERWYGSHALPPLALHFVSNNPGVTNYLELYGRYVGIYAPLPVLVSLASRFFDNGARIQRSSLAYWGMTALTLWGCKLIVVDWSATVNIIELISKTDTLGLPGIVWCYLALGILAMGGVFFWASLGSLISAKSALFGNFLLVPLGYLAIAAGLNQTIQKYDGIEFSALEFLLLGQRTGEWSTLASVGGWIVIQTAFVLILGPGLRLAIPYLNAVKSIADSRPSLLPREGSNTFARGMFIAVVFLISYGSLYPFDFTLDSHDVLLSRLATLFSPPLPGRGDTLGNILLFVPYGLFGVLALVPAKGDKSKTFPLLLTGLVLAFVLQVGQVPLPSRDPSIFDVLLNGCGIILGIWLAAQPWMRRLQASFGAIDSRSIPLCIAAAWVLSQWLPLVPTLDLAVVLAAIKPLFLHPELSLSETALYLVSWLTVFHLLRPHLIGRDWLVVLAPLTVLAGQPFVVGGELSAGEVGGSIAAGALWLTGGYRLKAVTLGMALLGATLAANLLPWDASFGTRNFHWVPFTGLLEGEMSRNLAALFRKLFQFGSVLWLLREGGISWLKSTVILATAMGIQEYLQTQTVGGTAEITDPLVALAVGITLASIAKGPIQFGHTGSASVPSGDISAAPPARALSSTDTDHLDGLDGLRAMAALSVFGVHFNQMIGLDTVIWPFELKRWLANGNTGVALFFVLSGFLLSLPFWKHALAGGSKVDIKDYFVRRLARILPAYYLCLSGLVLIMAARGNAPSFNNILSHLVFLHNINDGQILEINSPFWTLAVEMQFYFLLPLIMLALRPLSFGKALITATVLAIGTYVANYALISLLLERNQWPIKATVIWPFSLYISGPNSFVLTYSTLAHLSYFLIGLATAALFVRHRTAIRHRSYLADAVFFLCATGIFLILSTPLDDLLQAPTGHYNWPIVPILLAAMIFVVPRAQLARAILESRLVRWLGAISYGIYIYHYPIQKTLFRAFEHSSLPPADNWWLFALSSLVLTAILAAMSHYVFERPAMRWARRHYTSTLPAEASAISSAQIAPSPLSNTNQSTEKQESGHGWQKIRLSLGKKELRKLELISATENISISGAVRHILKECMSDQCASLVSENQPAETDSDPDGDIAETHEINLRGTQYAFLMELSERLNTTFQEVLLLMIGHYQARHR